jgi:hypothetical protein
MIGARLILSSLPIGHQHLNEVVTRWKMKLFVAVVRAISDRRLIRQRDRSHSYSDTLLIFMLKARRPARFRDNYVLPQNEGTDNTIVITGGLPAE